MRGQRVTITGTGFSPNERLDLQRLTVAIGGSYLPDLIHRSTDPTCYTTHLVCKRILDAFGTAKYTR